MASDSGNWFYVPLAGLVCVKGRKANGRRAAASMISVPKSRLIFDGDVESSLLLLSFPCVGEALSYTSAVARRYSFT